MLGSTWMWNANAVSRLARFLRNGCPWTCCSSCRNERLGLASCSGYGASQHPNPARGVSIERRRHSGVEGLRTSDTDVSVTHASASSEGVDSTPSVSR